MNKNTLRKVLWVVAAVILLNLIYKVYQVMQGNAETRELISLGIGVVALITLASAIKDNNSKKDI
ncbi:hypothetical protein [Metabacillus idriensis]|uniref:hypothetical protein n=1 Tax=Metabacillus idriensis TaxID=324768 RepID=UPI001749DB1A|nr:hypothetical protein [Metabacillus idriensis]